MGIVVDWDERRRQVSAIAEDLVAEAGIEGVTVRDVANKAGCSTAIVSHYFKNKRELILFTFHELSVRVFQQFEAQGDLQTALEALLPLDAYRARNTKVWLAFWGRAIADEELQQEQVTGARIVHKALMARLRGMQKQGEIAAGVDSDAEARRLLATVVGAAVQATFDPAQWPPKRLRALLAREIASITLRN